MSCASEPEEASEEKEEEGGEGENTEAAWSNCEGSILATGETINRNITNS